MVRPSLWILSTLSARECAWRKKRSCHCVMRYFASALRETRWLCEWTRSEFDMRQKARRPW